MMKNSQEQKQFIKMNDITCKLREIKIHRVIQQMKEDITKYMYSNGFGITLEDFVNQKYPEIKVEVERKYDETDKAWKINIIIQK